MASTGKSKRRVKGKTLDLNSFLANDQDAPSGFAVVNTHYDWGDVMEDAPVDDKFTLDYKKDSRIFLPTAPKAARGPDIDMSRIPSKPPFTAYVGNLPYDVNEEDIIKFFRQLKVTSVRLPREGGGERGRLRGFGYAEFADKQSLIEALALNNETLKNRAIRVNLAGDHENERDHDRRDDRSDRTAGDWRAGGRDDGFSRDDRQRNGTWYDRSDRGGRGGRRDMDSRDDFEWRKDRDRDRDSFSRRDDRGGYDRRDRGYERRDYGNRERDAPKERPRLQLKPRSVPLEPSSATTTGSSAIFGGAKPVDTAAKEREIEERLTRQKGTVEQRPRSYSDEDPNSGSTPVIPTKAAENHVSEVPQNKETKEQKGKPGASMATIFGDAKPVDTAAREREIEERLAKEREEQTKKLNTDQEKVSSSSRPPASARSGRYEGRSSSKQEGGDRGPRTGSRGRQGYYNRDNVDNRDTSEDRRENYSRRSSQDEESESKRQSSQSRGREERGTSGNRESQDRDRDDDDSKDALSHYQEDKPPVYTSTNKFVHLMSDDNDNDNDDVDNESTSE